MTYITLSEEQSRVIDEAQGPVEIRNAQGRAVARVRPLTPDELEMIARSKENMRKGGKSIPSAQVQAHFRRLEEIAKTEVLDEARTLELLHRMQNGEEV